MDDKLWTEDSSYREAIPNIENYLHMKKWPEPMEVDPFEFNQKCS